MSLFQRIRLLIVSRAHIANEILTTEKSYVESLNVCVVFYQKELARMV